MVSRLEFWKDGWAVSAERALLEVLEGAPFPSEYGAPGAATTSRLSPWFQHSLKSVMTSPDGSEEITVETMGDVMSAEEALELGKQAATSLLEKGGFVIIKNCGS